MERQRYERQSWQKSYFQFTKVSGRVLEIGVGHGTDLLQFVNADCHGVDITPRHLELTAQNFALRGRQVVLTQADATQLPYPDNHFEVVYSFGVLHHIPDVDAVIREIHRVLKPGGVVMLALYRRWSFFHAYTLLVRGILGGRLFRLGYAGLLARIESGADGTHIKPYVKLYTRRSLRRLLSGFTINDISVHELSLGSREPSFARSMLDALEPALGWYIACQATKGSD